MTAASPSRRSVLTALAAVPVAGVPALADVANTSEPDPIFALLDAARFAKAKYSKALEIEGAAERQAFAIREAEYGDDRRCNLKAIYPPLKVARKKCAALGYALSVAEEAALDAKARTLAGLAAQLIFAAESYESALDLDYCLVPLLVNPAWAIEGPLVSKIGLSEQLAGRLSEDQAEIES
jgi:hypothetical protein